MTRWVGGWRGEWRKPAHTYVCLCLMHWVGGWVGGWTYCQFLLGHAKIFDFFSASVHVGVGEEGEATLFYDVSLALLWVGGWG